MTMEAGEYLHMVEARVQELEKVGFAISGLDLGRVLAWHADGVPLRTVLAAMEQADRLRRREGWSRLSWKMAQRYIEAAMQRRAERVGLRLNEPRVPYDTSSEASPWRSLHVALTTSSAKAAEPVANELRAAWGAVTEAEQAGADPWTVAQTLDERLVEVLGTTLTETERIAMDEEIRVKVARLGKTASSAALAEALAFERARHLRSHFGVPELMAVLLERGET